MRHGFAGPTGLDYQGVLAAAQGLGMTMRPALFRAVQTAERTYLTVIDENKPTQPHG